MRIELAGSLIRPDPLVVAFTSDGTFDTAAYIDLGYTHFEVICIGAGGGKGGSVIGTILSMGGAGGGGGFHRVRGVLSALPDSCAVVVGYGGAWGTSDASNPALTTDGSDGYFSSFNATTCRASGGKGGKRAQSNSTTVTTQAHGGEGGIGNRTNAGGGAVGGLAGTPSTPGPGVAGSDGADGTLLNNIGKGGGGGAGGVNINNGALCNPGTKGGRGSYNPNDTSVYGPGYPAEWSNPGVASGAKAAPLNGLPTVYGDSFKAGVVVIRLTAEYLSKPSSQTPSPETYFGVLSMPITFGKVVSGIVEGPGPQTYYGASAMSVTFGKAVSGTGSPTFESATASYGTYASRDLGARTRNVPFTDEDSLWQACYYMQAGDYIYLNGPSFTITGHQFELDVLSQPASGVVLDLGDPEGAHVTLAGWPNIGGDADPESNNLFAIYIPFAKNLTIYGGELTNPSSSGMYIPHADNLKWYFFHAHDMGGNCMDLVPNTAHIINSDFFGEIDHWGQHTEGDPHAEKGTGIHGLQFGDGAGHITGTKVALYAHDGPTGAAIQFGSTGGVITGNTIILKAVNLTKVSTSQVAGNGINLWGSETMSCSIPYIEVTNAQGRAISVDGEYSLDFSDVVVEYGRANNTCINSTYWPPPSFQTGPTYQDIDED